MKRHKLLPLLGAAVVLLAGEAVRADVPRTINFSGRLSDSSGTPIDHPITIAFTIWDDATSLDPARRCYTKSEAGYMPTKGYVVYNLDTSVSSCDFAKAYWLQIQIGTDPPLLPRFPLAAVAYAISAQGLVDPATGTVYSGAGNLQGQIPINNGLVNQNLNVGMIDGYWWDDLAPVSHAHSGPNVCKVLFTDCQGVATWRLFAAGPDVWTSCPAGTEWVGQLTP